MTEHVRTRNTLTFDNKRDRFEQRATLRTRAVLKQLKILGNCSNKVRYDYNPEDVKHIFDALESELKRIKKKFNTERNSTFTLSSTVRHELH